MTHEADEQIPEEELPTEPDDISPNLRAWTKKALEVTNRASIDEKYRGELARRIK